MNTEPELKRSERYAADDAFVNSVFNYIRNFTLIMVLGGATKWRGEHIGTGFAGFLDYLVVGTMGTALICTWWLLNENFTQKMKRAPIPVGWKYILITAHWIVLSGLARYMVSTHRVG